MRTVAAPTRASAVSARACAVSSGLTCSSGSRIKIHSPVACSSPTLRAAAKSSRHGSWKTRAPAAARSATVSSVEPVSTTRSSS